MGLYLRRFFGFTIPVPPEHRKNFAHLYWDVAFWGILNGSIINFLGVYFSVFVDQPYSDTSTGENAKLDLAELIAIIETTWVPQDG